MTDLECTSMIPLSTVNLMPIDLKYQQGIQKLLILESLGTLSRATKDSGTSIELKQHLFAFFTVFDEDFYLN